MVSKGLLVRVQACSDKSAEVEGFLRGALEPVRQEAATTAWFAVQFGDGDYGVFDVFEDNAARLAHMSGAIPRELTKQGWGLLGAFPRPSMLDVLSDKTG